MKEKYEQIKKGKNLPSYEELDNEFCVGDIEGSNFLLKISEKIVEKTEKYRKILEEYLHADGSSIAVLMEIKVMDDTDKEKINRLYMELILIERSFLEAELENNEEKFLMFIEKAYNKWNENKLQIRELISKAKESWKISSKERENLGYLG